MVVRSIAENKQVRNYITKEISLEVSFAITEASDYSEKETTHYNRIYYVLEGKLLLLFDQEKVLLEKGDACFIEKGTTYDMSGTFSAVIINQPAFGV